MVAAGQSLDLAVVNGLVAYGQVAMLEQFEEAGRLGDLLRVPCEALAWAFRGRTRTVTICFIREVEVLGVFLDDGWHLSKGNDEQQAQKSKEENRLNHLVCVVDLECAKLLRPDVGCGLLCGVGV